MQMQLQETSIRQLCVESRAIFLSQPMLLELGVPVTICGDIHGQYEDLLRVFDTSGLPPKTNYLFLGDYVDRCDALWLKFIINKLYTYLQFNGYGIV